MNKLSYKVSLGGIISALCILLMFLTAVFPPLNMTIPIFTGLLIAMVAIETSNAWAMASYGCVAILSMFTTPDKEAAVLFIMFFGYYPVLQRLLNKMKKRPLAFVIKLIVFNAAIIAAYAIIIRIFGMVDIFSDFTDWFADLENDYGYANLSRFLFPALLLMGNAIFIFYDYVMNLLVNTYIKWFRPTFLRKINK